MFFKYRRRFAYWRFDRAVRGILDTAPLPVTPGRCTIVSMVAPHDTLMYLVTMKAFYRRVGGGRIVALIHHDMPAHQLDQLRRHFPGIELVVRDEIETGPCQRGNCWDRLVYILRLAEQGQYVVQIDSDVMVAGTDIDELVRCIETGTAFTMADYFRIVPVREAAAFARGLPGANVGDVVERELDRHPGAEALLYIRGSAGLAGFAPHGFPLRRLEAFHAEMERLVGAARWREWGTEQCASNFAVANTPGAVALPFPEYTSFHPGCDRTRAKMYHFIGSFRFDDGVFADLARREIAALARGA